MCGIALQASGVRVVDASCGSSVPEAQAAAQGLVAHQDAFAAALAPRGPDCAGCYEVLLPAPGTGPPDASSSAAAAPHAAAEGPGQATLRLMASLLQLRGFSPASCPLKDGHGSVLAYNGEIFGGLPVQPGQNDGQQLLAALGSADGAVGVPRVLSSLRGPWAILYWHAPSSTLFFGRDVLGRRSLVAHFPDASCGDLLLTSVVPASMQTGPAAPSHAQEAGDEEGGGAEEAVSAGAAAAAGAAGSGSSFGPGVATFWQEVPPGLYSLQLPQGMSHAAGGEGVPLMLDLNRHPWEDPQLLALQSFQRPADLIQPPALPPEQAETEAAQGPVHTTVAAAILAQSKGQQAPVEWPSDPEFVSAMEAVLAALKAAVQVRCACIEQHAASPPHASPLLILFSGGIDSTLLAALAHQCLPPEVPIDLSNVCFDGGRSPDRQAARHALEELAAYAPGRQWRLVEVNRTLDDVDAHKQRILGLLYPAGTVMDLNIGAALWLAAGAEGTLHLPTAGNSSEAAAAAGLAEGQAYRSEARVVLLGHGADEQCAGYGRHRTRFAAAGWAGLAAELAVDVKRLWVRNLGRDDRLVADWGREARHPFLDEGLIGVLLGGVPLWHIADLRRTPGVGDKVILRAALARLGLPAAAARIKRAIQFGSRIGKLSNCREFGSNRRANKASAGGVSLTKLPGTARKE